LGAPSFAGFTNAGSGLGLAAPMAASAANAASANTASARLSLIVLSRMAPRVTSEVKRGKQRKC
jgi:hypothetical protein